MPYFLAALLVWVLVAWALLRWQRPHPRHEFVLHLVETLGASDSSEESQPRLAKAG